MKAFSFGEKRIVRAAYRERLRSLLVIFFAFHERSDPAHFFAESLQSARARRDVALDIIRGIHKEQNMQTKSRPAGRKAPHPSESTNPDGSINHEKLAFGVFELAHAVLSGETQMKAHTETQVTDANVHQLRDLLGQPSLQVGQIVYASSWQESAP